MNKPLATFLFCETGMVSDAQAQEFKDSIYPIVNLEGKGKGLEVILRKPLGIVKIAGLVVGVCCLFVIVIVVSCFPTACEKKKDAYQSIN